MIRLRRYIRRVGGVGGGGLGGVIGGYGGGVWAGGGGGVGVWAGGGVGVGGGVGGGVGLFGGGVFGVISNFYSNSSRERLIKQGNYSLLMEKYFNHDPQFINDVIADSLNDDLKNILSFNNISDDISSDISSDTFLEVPYHLSLSNNTLRLDIDYPFYSSIYSKIPSLSSFALKYEPLMFKNSCFFESLIWLSYHSNDLKKISQLAFSNFHFSNKSWCYLLSCLIINYEIDFIKILLSRLCKNNLNSILFDVVLLKLIEYNTLFENIKQVFDIWINSGNSISSKSISLILSQYLKYGTNEEILKFNDFLEINNFSSLAHIKLVRLKHLIITQSRNNKKNITSIHYSQFENIINNVPPEEIISLYTSWFDFNISYSNLIEFIVSDLKKRGLVSHFLKLICKFYSKNDKFNQLLLILMSDKIKFNEYYIYLLFDCFIKTYPYHAPNFQAQFHQWIYNCNLNSIIKDRLLKKLKIIKIESQIKPYNLFNSSIFNYPQKYISSYWKDIHWKQSNSDFLKNQICYRINKGFLDIIKKGTRPDFDNIEKTYRRSNLNNRLILKDLLKSMRIWNKNKIKFELFDLQIDSTKRNIEDFYNNHNLNDFTTSNKLNFSRMLMDKGFYNQTIKVLKSIPIEDLDDNTRMIQFIIGVRNHINFGNYQKIIEMIDSFPINETILNPYILNQCIFIEKKLRSKQERSKQYRSKQERSKQEYERLERSNQEYQRSEYNDNPQLNKLIKKMQGFIGDIDLRLDQDSLDINKTMLTMFKFLNNWTKKDSIK